MDMICLAWEKRLAMETRIQGIVSLVGTYTGARHYSHASLRYAIGSGRAPYVLRHLTLFIVIVADLLMLIELPSTRYVLTFDALVINVVGGLFPHQRPKSVQFCC